MGGLCVGIYLDTNEILARIDFANFRLSAVIYGAIVVVEFFAVNESASTPWMLETVVVLAVILVYTGSLVIDHRVREVIVHSSEVAKMLEEADGQQNLCPLVLKIGLTCESLESCTNVRKSLNRLAKIPARLRIFIIS